MIDDRRFDRDLPGLLTDLAAPSMPPYRDDIVRRTALTRQRPAWIFSERWLPMDITARRVSVAPFPWRPVLVAVLVILTLLAAAILAGSRPQLLPAPPYGPAANGLIAFARDGDIYLGDPATGASRVIVGGPEVDTDPLFSRDGTQLVFKRQASGLYLARADGSGLRQLTDEPPRGVSLADWSGDGRFIVATVGSTGDPRPRLSMFLLDVDSGATHALDVGMGVRAPVFRPPNGAQIAFVGDRPGAPGVYLVDRDDASDLRLVAAGGAEDPGYFTPVSFSPDGMRIATSLPDPRGTGSEIHVIEPDGAGDRVLPNPPGVLDQWDPRWSPDGSQLVVVRSHPDWQLAVIPVEGGLGVDILPMADVFGTVKLSPDGRLVVFRPDDVSHDATVYGLTDRSTNDAPPWIADSWQRRATEAAEQPTPAPGP